MEKIKCEDERIQFLGLVQAIGFLLVTDSSGKILAASDNLDQFIPGINVSAFIDRNVEELNLLDLHGKNTSDFIQSTVNDRKSAQLVEIAGQSMHFTLSQLDELYYFEFERCTRKEKLPLSVFNNRMMELQYEKEHVWQLLSKVLSDNLQVDRVMVYQFNEDSSGVVVAETLLSTELDSYLGLNYPEFDIPKQARELYKRKHVRFIADVNQTPARLISNVEHDIDLSTISIRSLSPIHLQYIRNAGFESSISFSIMINGKLWGLICCQHRTPLHIDRESRTFALMLTNFAANRFQQLKDKKRIEYLKEVQELVLLLKEKVLLKSNFFPELKQYASHLQEILGADGIAIGFDDGIHLEGTTIDKEVLRSVLPLLRDQAKDGLFTDNSLSNHHPAISAIIGSQFQGIAFSEIDENRSFFIIWFRKEILLDRNWAGKPEKFYELDKEINKLKPSPRTSFNSWREQVSGTSPKWTNRQLLFIERIKHVLREGLINKATEIDNLNKQLIERNNALDTYAYTISHDLKNPLSAIKLSTEFLQFKREVKPEAMAKMTKNILDSVDIILNMLDKIHQFSKANAFNFDVETVETENFIQEIVDMSKHRFQALHVDVQLGDLVPVKGERTLIYQLFLNLVGNAIKYSSKSPNPVVQVSSAKTNNGTIYTIQDTGIGMAEEELETVFEIFKRMSNSTNFDGSGVGMAIVKRITDKLGIDISIKSKLGEGTTIRLMFQD
ncbi:ATP-binding protein [Sphingobacterium lactis]|uniref:ATP-binding protein n=1 Tax=Sphingobacterium lactis TaxID=797291 RepID=UPI003DA56886